MSFTFFSSMIFLTVFVFIFYIALIMKFTFFFAQRLARKPLNQIFTQSKQLFISSFDCDICLDYVPFFTKSVKLDLGLRVHLTIWIQSYCTTLRRSDNFQLVQSLFVTQRKKIEEVKLVDAKFLHKKVNKNVVYMRIILC